MNRRHNRFQPALSPLEDRLSLSYTIVNSYQNNAHIWGTVQVYNHRATLGPPHPRRGQGRRSCQG